MFDNAAFQQLVEGGQPTGEVVAADRFIITVKGLGAVTVGASVLFENGQLGMVREVRKDYVVVLNMMSEELALGTLVVLEGDSLSAQVGSKLLGRVVSPLGKPLDGKGPVNLIERADIFGTAPGIIERSGLTDQLITGVSMVDSLFPIAYGQRMAILGDNKAGKSTFLTQLTISQAAHDKVVVYVVICKRKVEVDRLLGKLEAAGALKNTVIVVANVFDSLVQAYLAPYIGCAIAEYFWKQGTDAVAIYDDLSTHAKVYREMSLLLEVTPGRDSYPGDMFYTHSSLLERAGKLAATGKTMTALPVLLTPNEDITALLPTNAMSITDGQIIFDLGYFRQGIRPAVHTGLSVSRVGGRTQDKRSQKLTNHLFKQLAAYKEAVQFSHFGSELAEQSKANLYLGKRLYEAFKQLPDVIYTLTEQQLLLDVILRTAGEQDIDVVKVKERLPETAAKVDSDEAYETAIRTLLAHAATPRQAEVAT